MYKSFDKFGARPLSEVVLRGLVLQYQAEREHQRLHAKFKLEHMTKKKLPDTAVSPFLKDLAAHLGKDAYIAIVQTLALVDKFHSAVDRVLPLLDADDSASVVLRSPDGAPICKLSLGGGCNCNASTNWLLPCAHILCVLARRRNGLHSFTDVAPYIHERWVLSRHTALQFPYLHLADDASAGVLAALQPTAAERLALPVQVTAAAAAAGEMSDEDDDANDTDDANETGGGGGDEDAQSAGSADAAGTNDGHSRRSSKKPASSKDAYVAMKSGYDRLAAECAYSHRDFCSVKN
jgi:hypothetical protein